MERLDHMLRDAINYNKIRPIKLCNSDPALSHLFFVDDLLVFLEVDGEQVTYFMEIIEVFCCFSSQKINLSKSKLCVSKNVTESLARNLSRTCNIPLTKCLGKYRGVPLLHDKVNATTFFETVYRDRTKLSSWKANTLSLAGRITLVNSITAAAPNHIMQTNLLPNSTLDKVDKLNKNFIWGNTVNNRKIHLLKWDIVCRPKKIGGTRIRKSLDSNKVFLMKLLWKIWKEPNSYWVTILALKYKRDVIYGGILELLEIVLICGRASIRCSMNLRQASLGASVMVKLLPSGMTCGLMI
ncbi:hypothetical protein M5689_003349 [Euphorbia peplus]|nr:hypothetical protein M5689_003349 [Euphorbia peplus]